MKGCLKSPALTPGSECLRKCVAFGAEGSEEIHTADEWDRTPMEPARHLSYRDLLELKEIQRSLPRANQLSDPVSGKPASHFLSAVPIGLLPLLSEGESGGSRDSSVAPSPVTSPPSSSPATPNWGSPILRPTDIQPLGSRFVTPQWHPPHLAHLMPGKPVAQRQKPRFAFVPLLDTPPTSALSSPYPSNPPSRSPSPDLPAATDHFQDPPTPSLTDASQDSSPISRASSSSPEPSLFSLPPLRKAPSNHYDSYFPTYADERGFSSSRSSPVSPGFPTMKLEAIPSPALLPPSPLILDAAKQFPSNPPSKDVLFASKPIRRRNFILVNDVEIELDADDDDEVQSNPDPPVVKSDPCPYPTPTSTPQSKTVSLPPCSPTQPAVTAEEVDGPVPSTPRSPDRQSSTPRSGPVCVP
ncbi:hypothetical protein BD779DRAFT_1671859 [Infundibulicybe gibba]|nr:hypothetical protein BD779DRAFT_1671859 [Infundibulicybe gibba]